MGRRINQLPIIATATTDDVIPLMDAPGGSSTTSQITVGNLASAIQDINGGGGGGLGNVVEDLTPQLGGNLDLNSFTVGAASAADLTKLNALTATSTELNYTDGVTSAIQTQLDAKQATLTGLTSSVAELNIVDGVTATAAELNYTDGVTSAIQTQLDAKLALAGGTMTGNITLAENAAVALDPAGSADGKYTGLTITGTAGATLAFGDLIYLDPTDSRWELADANSAAAADGDSRGTLGICVLAAASDGSATNILLHGVVRADTAFPALTINAPVYVSETAGDIVVAQPTTTDAVIRVVGVALTADEIYFNPSPDYITHI